jgi:hypothetical protein
VQRQDGSPHARTGGQTVIDDDDGSVGHVERGPPVPVRPLPPDQFQALRPGHPVEDPGRDIEVPNHILVEDQGAAAGDGSHRQFLLAGNAQLPHDEHVERRSQCRGHLVGHRYASPGQRQDHHIGPAPVLVEVPGEHASSLTAVLEPAVFHIRRATRRRPPPIG